MKIKYCGINEIIKILETKGLNVDLENIRSCVRERLIHPIIYIDSFPAYACEIQPDGSALAVGFCFLSAYLNAGDNIIAIFNTLMRKDTAKIKPWINVVTLQDDFEMLDWQYSEEVFAQVPPKSVLPKPYSKQLKIEIFNLLQVEMTLKNVMISIDEISILAEYLAELTAATKERKNNIQKDLTTREANAFLNIIGALVTYIYKKVSNTNQTRVISDLLDSTKDGLSKSNLDRKIPAALECFEGSSTR